MPARTGSRRGGDPEGPGRGQRRSDRANQRGSAIVGGIIGALGAWWGASSTNKIQKQIADSNSKLQRDIADSNLAFQKKLAEDSANATRRALIEAMVLKLSEFAIAYPTLEKDAYCDAYPNCPGDPNGKERYESYCVYVFNTLGAAFDFCGGDKKKMSEFIGVEELVRRHHRCWLADRDNLGHDEPFRQYIHGVIDDLKKRGEIK